MSVKIQKHVQNDISWRILDKKDRSDNWKERLVEEAPFYQSSKKLKEKRTRHWSILSRNERPDLFIKTFLVSGISKKVRYTIGKSPALREWTNLLTLHTSSVPVPEPVAMGEQYQNGVMTAGILATEYLPDTTSLAEHLPEQIQSNRGNWVEQRDELWKELAKITEQLVEENIHAKDYHLGNVLLDQESNLYITDLHSATRRHWFRKHHLKQMLVFLMYSITTKLPIWECRRFYEFLREETELQPLPSWADLINGIQKRWRNHMRSRSKRCVKNSSIFTHTTPRTTDLNEPFSIWKRRSISDDQIQSVITQHKRITDPDSPRMIKQHKNRKITRQPFPSPDRNQDQREVDSVQDGSEEGDTRNEEIIVKELSHQKPRRKLERLFLRSRSRKSWKNARALRVRSFPAPKCWALVEPSSSFSSTSSYLLQRAIPNSTPLDQLIWTLEDLQQTTTSPPLKSVLREDLSYFLLRLHRHGIYHKDLKANNVLVQIQNESSPDQSAEESNGLKKTLTSSDSDQIRFSFHLVDLDRMTFYDRPLPLSKRVKNLAQLNASLPPFFSKTDRMRTWKTYFRTPVFRNRASKNCLKTVLSETKARNHRWPKK